MYLSNFFLVFYRSTFHFFFDDEVSLRRFRGTAIFALVALVTLFRLLVRVVRAEGALLAAIFWCKFIIKIISSQ